MHLTNCGRRNWFAAASSRRNRVLRTGVRALFVILLSLNALAQQGRDSQATLQGKVQDRARAAISGVTVVARELETGRSRTVESNERGEFRLSGLQPGRYELQLSRSGYVSLTQDAIELAAGQMLNRNFVLERAAESTASAAANLISESQLVGLPLNGRSYSQLATLQAGVSDPSAEQASRGVSGGNLTIAGSRSTSNSFLLDGTNIMDTFNRLPRSAAGVQLGSDAVYQVQVFSTTISSEYGRGSGGVLNSITRSGSNEFHGSLFEYLRNSKTDARKFIDPTETPPFKRNQFGFTVTGPVRKDATFFMVSYEAMRDRLTDTDLTYFADEKARQGIITDAAGNVIQTVEVNPRVRPYLDLMPIPNLRSTGGGFGINSAPVFQPTNESYWTLRVDHKLSYRDSLFARYTFDDASSVSGSGIYLFFNETQSRQQYATLVGSHIFNLSLLTAFRFGYTRPQDRIESTVLLDVPRSLYFVPDAPQFGQIELPSVATFGPPPTNPERNVMNAFQFANDWVRQMGPHAIKFGGEIHRYRWEVRNSFQKSAVWSFNSLASFLQGGPDGTNLGVVLPGSSNRKSFRETLAGFYVQDNYRFSSRLQFNFGVRYEFATIIKEKYGKVAYLPDLVHDTTLQTGHMLKDNPSLLNFSPRLSFTWSPGSRQRDTVLSGGFGIYYDPMLEYMVDLQKNTAPFNRRAVCVSFNSSTTFPDAVLAAQDPSCSRSYLVEILDYNHMSSPMVLRYNFGLQQLLPGGWRVQANYVGARGNHLFRGYETNLFPVPLTLPDGRLCFPGDVSKSRPGDPPGCALVPSDRAAAINPNFGAIRITSTDAQSFYNALQVTANKNLGQGASVQANYTFSRSVDDGSSYSSGESQLQTRQYALLRSVDRGLSDFDLRHRLAINYFYSVPVGAGHRWGRTGLVSQAFGGWRLGGILSLRTGSPFHPRAAVRDNRFLLTANRPNLLPGHSNNPTSGVSAGCEGVRAGEKLGGPDRYYDPCVFEVPELGTLGNLGRDTIIGPGVWTMDVSLQKEFVVGGEKKLQFRAESFNLLNRNNFAAPAAGSGVIATGAYPGRRNTTAGRSIRILTNARQIQFALRLSF